MGFLDLETLLKSIDAILALDIGAVLLLGVSVEGVDGVGDFLPVLLTEVAAVEMDEMGAPSMDEGVGGFFGPAVFSRREGGRGAGGGVES